MVVPTLKSNTQSIRKANIVPTPTGSGTPATVQPGLMHDYRGKFCMVLFSLVA